MRVLFAVLLLFGSVLAAGREPGNAEAKEWVPLLNGKNLDGWVVKIAHHELGDNYRDTFRVEDGTLKVSYDKYDEFGGRFGHLYYGQKLSHYVLAVEYRFVGQMMKDAPSYVRLNSGIMVHSQAPETMPKDQNFPISVEAQLLGETADATAERATMNVCTPGTEIFMKGSMVTAHCTNSTSRT